jgi:hypothetical protein
MVCAALRTGDCADEIKQAIATKVIALLKAGERNPDTLCEEVLKDNSGPLQKLRGLRFWEGPPEELPQRPLWQTPSSVAQTGPESRRCSPRSTAASHLPPTSYRFDSRHCIGDAKDSPEKRADARSQPKPASAHEQLPHAWVLPRRFQEILALEKHREIRPQRPEAQASD